jgi:hypothetical protein
VYILGLFFQVLVVGLFVFNKIIGYISKKEEKVNRIIGHLTHEAISNIRTVISFEGVDKEIEL